MQLRYSPTSPYVRKVTATIIELGLGDRIERVATNPWDSDTDLPDANPIGKVPALICDNGSVLYDSPVICEYLDSLHDGSKLFPASGPSRWTALRQQALGDGILDASVSRILESRRPEEKQLAPWVERQRNTVIRCLDRLEDEADNFAGAVRIGHIVVGCALGYIDFRFSDDDWRQGRPGLAAWYGEFSGRPSMQQTVPKE
jgi:glutathione S-transferase